MADDNDIIAQLKVEGKDKFVADLKVANDATVKTTSSIEKMEQALADLPKGSKDFEKLANELEAVKIATVAGADAFENNRKKLTELKKDIGGLATVLATLKQEGKQNTQTFKDIQKEFENTKKKAGELQDKIEDINTEVKNLGSDTRGIDNVVRGVTLVANSYQLAVGATALFGKENKNLEQGLIKLNGVMAITQSLQQIGNELTKEDSIVKQAASKATALYNLVVGQSTGALKLFRLALAATGIGLAVIGIAALVENWDRLKVSILGATVSLEDYNKQQKENNDTRQKALEQLAAENAYLVASGQLTQKEADKRTLTKKAKDLAVITDELSKQEAELRRLEKIGNEGATLKGFINFVTGKPINQAAEQKKIVDEQIALLEKTYVELKDANEDFQKKYSTTAKVTESKEAVKSSANETNKFLEDVALERQQKEQEMLDKNVKSFDDAEQKKRDAAMLTNQILQETYLENIADNQTNLNKKNQSQADSNRAKEELYQEEIKAEQNVQNQRLKGLQVSAQIASDINNLAMDAVAIKTANELNLLKEKKERGLITEKQYQEEEAKIKNEAAQKQRKADIAMAVAKIPLIVLQAYTSVPFPFSIALAAIAGALAVAQVGILAAAPLPKFKQGGSVAKRLGLINGKKHESGGVPIEVEGGEYVMKSKAVQTYGVKFLDDINNMKLNPVLASQSKMQNKRNSDYRLNEHLATIGGYLKQTYKTDSQGNVILKEISQKIGKQNRAYV